MPTSAHGPDAAEPTVAGDKLHRRRAHELNRVQLRGGGDQRRRHGFDSSEAWWRSPPRARPPNVVLLGPRVRIASPAWDGIGTATARTVMVRSAHEWARTACASPTRPSSSRPWRRSWLLHFWKLDELWVRIVRPGLPDGLLRCTMPMPPPCGTSPTTVPRERTANRRILCDKNGLPGSTTFEWRLLPPPPSIRRTRSAA